MSQFQREHQDASDATLDLDSLIEKQRRLLLDMSPSTTAVDMESNSALVTDTDGAVEQEWISNWQFERVVSNKKHSDIDSSTTSLTNKIKSGASNIENIMANSEGGVFYFERVQSSCGAIIPSTPSMINTTDSSSTITLPLVSSTVSDIDDINQSQQFGQQELFMEMTIENDDLFADLEAAADSNDDSELSLDELIDMEVDDNHRIHDHVQHYQSREEKDDNFMGSFQSSQNSGTHEVNDFLNKSTTAPINELMGDNHNDDFEMMNTSDNGNIYSYSSPVTSKECVSSSPYGSMSHGNSPTSVALHMAPPPLSSCSMSTASTRPALQHMRKMMTNLLDNGNMPRAARRNSQLPCAEGMDEMYLDTMRKLSASMARTKKSRKSLSIPIQRIQSNSLPLQDYSRSMCVNQILQSVQTSSRHVDTCLQSVRMMNR